MYARVNFSLAMFLNDQEIRREKAMKEELTMQLQEKEFHMNRLISRQKKVFYLFLFLHLTQ